MSTAINYKKSILNLTEGLPIDKLKELVDFAQFLKAKTEGFSYAQIKADSVDYVNRLRGKESIKAGSGKKFIDELIKWQKSNS